MAYWLNSPKINVLIVRILSIFAFISVVSAGHAQFDHESVLPDLSGEDLLTQLVDDFKPGNVLDFGEAKDVMYASVYAQHDSVRCVYTGHTLYLDPDADPSQYLYLDGSPNGINAEHNYPKSKGASSGNALSDMYNLFPSRVAVNSDRGNLAFGEIPDPQSLFWYYLEDKITEIPSENIDAYSEISSALFEPREDHKGNVARSIFYFVTMYADEVEAVDPSFFEAMRSTLCDWHFMDPVDSLEWDRNERIASYQSGKKNPFVLDCSLAGRSYCDYIDEACRLVNAKEPTESFTQQLIENIYPNPASTRLNVQIDNLVELKSLEILDILGSTQRIWKGKELKKYRNDHHYSIPVEDMNSGLYLVRVWGVIPGGEMKIDQKIWLIQG
jgi:hypothetical protein